MLCDQASILISLFVNPAKTHASTYAKTFLPYISKRASLARAPWLPPKTWYFQVLCTSGFEFQSCLVGQSLGSTISKKGALKLAGFCTISVLMFSTWSCLL